MKEGDSDKLFFAVNKKLYKTYFCFMRKDFSQEIQKTKYCFPFMMKDTYL